MTSMKCSCPWNNHCMLERAVVLELDRPEFEILFFHYKWHCVTNIISFSELTIMTRLMDVRILEYIINSSFSFLFRILKFVG